MFNDSLTAAQQKLVVDNMSYAACLAGAYVNNNPVAAQHSEDLRSEAYTGLVAAAACYDAELSDAAFMTYAYKCIHSYMATYTRRHCNGPVPKPKLGSRSRKLVPVDEPTPNALRHMGAVRLDTDFTYVNRGSDVPLDLVDPADGHADALNGFDAGVLTKRARAELPAFIRARTQTGHRALKLADYAQRVGWFLDVRFGSETLRSIAASTGFTFQRVSQVVNRVAPHFEAWARVVVSREAGHA